MTELRLLRSFAAVAEELHFARAAERLHMAQPPLSQQIRRLERELDTQLLNRTTRRVELTPAGTLLQSRVRDILQAVDDAAHDARRAAAGELGRLAIGFTGSTTYTLMPAIAAALRRDLPGVELELRGELLTAAQVNHLLSGALDLALLRPPVRERDLIAEVIRREALVVVLPEHHHLAKADVVSVLALAEEPFVSYPPFSVVHDAVAALCAAHGFAPREALIAGETSTLVGFVAADMGVSLAPASVTQLTVAGAVYRSLDEDAEVKLALAWRRDASSPSVTRAITSIRATAASLTAPARPD